MSEQTLQDERKLREVAQAILAKSDKSMRCWMCATMQVEPVGGPRYGPHPHDTGCLIEQLRAALLAKQAAPGPDATKLAITLICRTCEKPYSFNGIEIPGGPDRDFCGGSCYNYFHADKKWTDQSEQPAAPADKPAPSASEEHSDVFDFVGRKIATAFWDTVRVLQPMKDEFRMAGESALEEFWFRATGKHADIDEMLALEEQFGQKHAKEVMDSLLAARAAQNDAAPAEPPMEKP